MPSAGLASMRVMVNMAVTIAAALNFLSSLSSLIGQPSLGGLRLIFSVLSMYVLTRCDAVADSGRLGFICHPETNDIHREQCFSRYSAEMSPLMRPYLFLLVTACILVCLWTTMILYSFRHLPKIRRETFSSKREHLCHEFWKKFLFHVGSEAVVLSVILGLFCFTQKIYFAETYNCTLRNAPVKIVLTCTDLYQWDKSFLNIVLIGVMALMLLFCIGTVYQAMCNEENFIKELLTLNITENEADDGANHHRNTQFIGSSGFTNTGNPNKQQVPKTLEDLVNDPYNILGEICRCLDTTTVGLGNYEDVAKYFGFDVTVQSRFKPSPDGPSKALILSIIAVQPDVTVEAFAKVVENQARRKDVARLLREFDRKGTSSEP